METEKAPNQGEYQEGKLWFHRKGKTVTIGMTSLAVEEVGEVQSVDLPTEAEDYEKGDVLCVVDGATGKVEITAPATGTIKETNESIADEPGIVSEDPLEEGWIIKLEIEDTSDLKEFAGL